MDLDTSRSKINMFSFHLLVNVGDSWATPMGADSLHACPGTRCAAAAHVPSPGPDTLYPTAALVHQVPVKPCCLTAVAARHQLASWFR